MIGIESNLNKSPLSPQCHIPFYFDRYAFHHTGCARQNPPHIQTSTIAHTGIDLIDSIEGVGCVQGTLLQPMVAETLTRWCETAPRHRSVALMMQVPRTQTQQTYPFLRLPLFPSPPRCICQSR